MTRKEQKKFVNELCRNVAKRIREDIDLGKVPDYWDGLELRQLIADRADQANDVAMPKSRKRSYTNIVIVNNL